MRSIIILSFLISIAFNAAAQTPAVDTSGQPIIMVRNIEGKNFLQWLPRNPMDFQEGYLFGYRVERRTNNGTATTIATKVLSRDTTYFLVPESDENAQYMRAIATWLHRIPITPAEKGSPDLGTARYNYLVNEASESPDIATALGLAVQDSTATPDAELKYELFSNKDNRSLGSVSFKNVADTAVTNSTDELSFTFLDGRSLSVAYKPVPSRINKISGMSRVSGDSVLIRWSPNDAILWKDANKNGYVVQRVSLDSLEEDPVMILDTIRPFTLAQFNALGDTKDPSIMAAAQVLYGKKVSVGTDAGVFNETDEGDFRFAIAVQSAEKSALAARALGLLFVDKTVKKGTNYIYTIKSATVSRDGEALIFVATDSNTVVARKPTGLKAEMGEHIVTLSWDTDNRYSYSSFKIAKSADGGKTKQLLTPEPIVFLESQQGVLTFQFNDTVETNYKKYTYYVQGRDAFALWSDAASVEGFGRDLTPPGEPIITKNTSDPQGISLEWRLDSLTTDLRGFNVLISTDIEGTYKPINKNYLPPTTRSFRYTEPLNTALSYYFKISLVDTSGNISYSPPQFVVVIDSIAPLMPTGFIAKIDTNGVVTLMWNHGREPDMKGYRVYFSNNKNAEMALLTVDVTEINGYYDTLGLNTLNKDVYYAVLAEDLNGNQSELTPRIKLVKPDRIPPTAPILNQTTPLPNGINLDWILSSSSDVSAHILYRKLRKDSSNTEGWSKIAEFKKGERTYADLTAETEQLYLYSMQAVDSANNLSPRTFPVLGRRFFEGNTAGVKNLSATFDKTADVNKLTWTFSNTGDAFLEKKQYSYFVYRAKGTGQLEKYAQISDPKPNYNDDEVEKDSTYRYAVRVVYEDGKVGEISPEVTIETKK